MVGIFQLNENLRFTPVVKDERRFEDHRSDSIMPSFVQSD